MTDDSVREVRLQVYIFKNDLDWLVSMTGPDSHSEFREFLLDHPQACKTPTHIETCAVCSSCTICLF